MNIKLLNITPLDLIVTGIRTCYSSQDKSDSFYHNVGYRNDIDANIAKFTLGEKDKALIKNIIKSSHHSCLEHSSITFSIEGISRTLLQEFSRHRIGISPSIKSTRYTLSELKHEKSFWDNETLWDYNRAGKYVVFTGTTEVDSFIISALENARVALCSGWPNDKVKYCLPEAYKTSGQYTMNFRSLRHLLELRTSPRALWEFRRLAYKLYETIPEEYKFLLEDCIFKDN